VSRVPEAALSSILPYTQPYSLLELMNKGITTGQGGKEGPPFGNTSDTFYDGRHLLYLLTVHCVLHGQQLDVAG